MIQAYQDTNIAPTISFDNESEPQISSVVDDILNCSRLSKTSEMFENEGLLMQRKWPQI